MKNTLTPEQVTEKLEQHNMTQASLARGILVRPESITRYIKGTAGAGTRIGKRAFWFFERLEGR